MRSYDLSAATIDQVEFREREELARRLHLYRGDLKPLSLEGRNVIIINDGLATGATAKVAIRVARNRGAHHVIVAVPVASIEALSDVAEVAEQAFSTLVPRSFQAVGEWYEDFDQTSDDEVVKLLADAAPGTRSADTAPTT